MTERTKYTYRQHYISNVNTKVVFIVLDNTSEHIYGRCYKKYHRNDEKHNFLKYNFMSIKQKTREKINNNVQTLTSNSLQWHSR